MRDKIALLLRIASARLFDIDRVFACFGQTVRSPILDPLDQIGVAVPWYYHVLVSLGVAVAWYRRVMVVLGDVETMRSLGDTTNR
jgi:hypothetical protein